MQDEFEDIDDESYLLLDLPDERCSRPAESVQTDKESTDKENADKEAEGNVDEDVRVNADQDTVAVNADKAAEANAVEHVEVNADKDTGSILTIREYCKVFAKQNKNHGSTKIPNSNPPMASIRPRVKLPNRGRPQIYVAEGVQCQNGPRLLCPGRTGTTTFFDNGKSSFVVLGVIWVSLCVLS